MAWDSRKLITLDLLEKVQDRKSLDLAEVASSDINEPKLVVTLNVSHLRQSSDNPEYLTKLLRADFLIADGKPIIWILKFLKGKTVSRWTGVDLVQEILSTEDAFFIVGSSSTNIAHSFKSYFPLKVPNLPGRTWSEVVNLDDEEQRFDLASNLERVQPRVVFLALGNPKGENLYFEMKRQGLLPPALYIGVGGSFELLAGRYSRAPSWIQSLGFEWFWRMIQEPFRLMPRYYQDAKWLLNFLNQN